VHATRIEHDEIPGSGRISRIGGPSKAGGMHAGIESPALLIDPNLCHAGFHWSINKMNDSVQFLRHVQYQAIANPAGIRWRSAALWMKQRGSQQNSKLVSLGSAVCGRYVGFKVVALEKRGNVMFCVREDSDFLLYEASYCVIIR
jgi:hypothetical protein